MDKIGLVFSIIIVVSLLICILSSIIFIIDETLVYREKRLMRQRTNGANFKKWHYILFYYQQ